MSDIAGKGCEILVPFSERKPLEEIERSLIKKYRKGIWSKFIKAIKDYELVEEGDKVAVAVSGGKDSMLMAKLFQELQRHGDVRFEVEFIAMDPGYHEDIRKLLVDNCEYLNIPIHIFESGIFRIVDNIAKDYPCYMCAKMRRGALYSKAGELGCNKLALGHHFNDVIETTLLNVLYTGSFKTMLPRLKSSNFKGLELIRPLYYVEEQYIERFTQNNGIWPLNCACMVAAERIANKRYEIKDMIKELKERIPNVDTNIMRAAQNVNMEAILGWHKGGKHYSYLDFYEDFGEEE
ncbi:MAG: tRNA 2-thiocytidine biosynthesis TtcA family protein [Caulobacteraceae bacterium]